MLHSETQRESTLKEYTTVNIYNRSTTADKILKYIKGTKVQAEEQSTRTERNRRTQPWGSSAAPEGRPSVLTLTATPVGEHGPLSSNKREPSACPPVLTSILLK